MAGKSSIERLAARLGVESGSRKVGRTTILRLTLYYVVVIAIIAVFILFTATMRPLDSSIGVGPGGLTLSSESEQIARVSESFWAPIFNTLPPLAYGAAAVVGAFLLALPVAFVYVRTRSSLKYDQSLVQTVIMLPVVVTAILIVVKNSLALAFSLAGIVAAVRFRNNLKDSRDAVYIFAAVGIGFAAGVGQLSIATFLSVFFAVLELLLWKLDLTADHERTFGMLCMPAPADGEYQSKGALMVEGTSDATPMAPSADTTLLALGGAEPAPNGKPSRAMELLRLYVTDPDKAKLLAEGVLSKTTKEFKHKKTRSSGRDQYLLEYQFRPRKKFSSDAIIERMYLDAAPYVIAAESSTQAGERT